MTDKTQEFVNPDCLPVENVTLTASKSGIIQNIKALDPFWVDNKDLLLYERPPSGPAMVMGAVELWQNKMETYLDNLKWLLSLSYHRFWSTILYHHQCMDSLVSFLQEADPPYMPPADSKDIHTLYKEIRRYVLVVFCRLITNRESEREWMTREFMADAVYHNFIFTIPVLWDICLVYGSDNQQRVSRLINGVFTLQPQYERDATAAVAFVNEAFKYIILQVNKDYDSEEPPNLPETFKGFGEIHRPTNNKPQERITFNMLRDLVIHLLDTAMTLRIFIQVYSKAVNIFKKTNFVNSIVQIYEYGIPQLYEKLEEVGDPMSIAYTEVEGHIDSARSELIDIFREILAVYKDCIFSGEGSIESHVESYLTVMMDGLSEKLLIRDYHSCYPVHEDVEMLRQAYPEIDPVKTDFILQAIYSNLEEPVPEHLLSTNQEPATSSHVEPTIDNTQTDIIDNNIPDKIKEESLISEVRDILPHLGDGFILKCLKFYNFEPARVVNCILEDNLDESLKGIDQTLPIIPEDPLDKNFLETGVARLNVFDGDEFDIMTRDDVDVSRIHVGKRKDYKNWKEMLNDKTQVRELADVYNKYSIVCDETDVYLDDYDDEYISDGPAPPADITPDEIRRPFVTPRALQTNTRIIEESSSESEVEQDKATTSNKNKLDFCVNPEELRAKREASWQARRGKGHRPPPKTTDVTGKPKGQGQEKEVLVSRDKKEKHKSSRANHNRRQGAQWKRSQGLMPS